MKLSCPENGGQGRWLAGPAGETTVTALAVSHARPKVPIYPSSHLPKTFQLLNLSISVFLPTFFKGPVLHS